MTDHPTPDPTGQTTDDRTDRTRSIELEIEVPGNVDEVWETIATGPGITSWFIPMQVEEREGGKVIMDWGSFGSTTADVVAWEPPHRVVFRGDEDDRSLAYEWLVEARDGGTCVVRLVNSGFGEGDDWDGQYHGMAEGWKLFLQHLRLQLTHFPGRHARAFIPTVGLAGPHDAAWVALCDALGIAADAAPGDRISTAADAPRLAGRIETTLARPATAYLLVLDDPLPGTAFITVEGEGDQVAASAYLYLYPDDDHPLPDGIGEQWVAWLNERCPPIDAGAELLD